MSRKKIETLSWESLREQEFSLQSEEQGLDFSELNAEQELDFNLEIEREYQPEVWEVENDATDAPDDEEPL